MAEAMPQRCLEHRRQLTPTQTLPRGLEPQPFDDGMQRKPEDAREVALQRPRRNSGRSGHGRKVE
jgi:hypothetical protein